MKVQNYKKKWVVEGHLSKEIDDLQEKIEIFYTTFCDQIEKIKEYKNSIENLQLQLRGQKELLAINTSLKAEIETHKNNAEHLARQSVKLNNSNDGLLAENCRLKKINDQLNTQAVLLTGEAKCSKTERDSAVKRANGMQSEKEAISGKANFLQKENRHLRNIVHIFRTALTDISTFEWIKIGVDWHPKLIARNALNKIKETDENTISS